MPGMTKEAGIQQVFRGGGHVVILGAGASIAATIRGNELNGKRLPSMDNFVNVVGLSHIVEQLHPELRAANFEALYSKIHNDNSQSEYLKAIQDRVQIYFKDMQLPNKPTIYDYLILSLRNKDLIATFKGSIFISGVGKKSSTNRNMQRRSDGDETWSRLLHWTRGQKASERLAAHLLASEGFKSIDPGHPLGGKDGVKDIVALKDNIQWIAGCYFPRGQISFKNIKEKFIKDLKGVDPEVISGFVFITNQELRLGERKVLIELGRPCKVDILHLERLTHILNTPKNYGLRLEYLDIELTKEEQVSFFASKDIQIRELSGKIQHLLIDYSNFKRSFEFEEGWELANRDQEDVFVAIETLVDRIWYNRHQSLKERVLTGKTEVDAKIWQGALEAAKRVEQKYGEENLWHDSDFEWGLINGKLSALRWIMGDDWDMLDT